jgi:hypothetical protein
MRHRTAASLGVMAAALVVGSLGVAQVSGQAQKPAGESSTFTPPRTADGKPNFEGMWTYAAGTPGDVPMETGGNARNAAGLKEDGYMGSGGTRKSQVIDPPTGKIPLRPEAEAARDYDFAHIGENWVYLTPWERCISRGIPGSMIPANYNNSYQIVQSPGVFTVLHEMIHDARIIPTDGSPHLPAHMRFWMGDARGRWEGDTLVVETTNFNDKGDIAQSGANGRMRGIRHSDKLHVVERFKLIGPNTIRWEARVTDPDVYTAPWTVSIDLDRNDKYEMFEYACHEGNYTVPNSLLHGPSNTKN